MSVLSAGPDPDRVFTTADLTRELDLLRRRAALGTRKGRLSLADLAKLVDLPRSTLHTYLSGLTLATADVLDRIVIALGASPAEQAQWSEAWFRVSAHQHEERRAAPARVPRQLPADTVAFTGREEALVELDDLLATGGTAVISAIAGTAGVGKTALAVHWGHRVADRFPDGQLYVNLRGYDPGDPVRPAQALGAFLRALGVTDDEVPHDLAEGAALYRTLLAERRVLVVLDNARSPEQVRDLLPGTSRSFALVTSRDTLGGLVVRDGARRIVLDLMHPAESIDLLRSLIGDRVDAEPDAAHVLSEQCARLPLALRIAAEMARSRPDATLADVLDDLGDERRRLDLLDADGDAHTAVRAVFSWSYRQLTDQAARLFRLLGAQPGQDIGEFAAAALLGVDVPEVVELLARLEAAYLVDTSTPGRYSMHDLLRAYATERADEHGDELQVALTRLFDHYRHGAAMAMDALYPAERDARPKIHGTAQAAPPLVDADSARSWLDGERRNLLGVVSYTAARGWPAHATDLASTMWRHLDTGSHNSDVLAVHQAALHAARVLGDQTAEADALRYLGMAHRAVGDYAESLDCSQRALAIRRVLGDTAGEVEALNSLALVYDCLGRYADSVDQHRQAIVIRRGLGDRRGEGVTLLNLAVTQLITGRYDEAQEGLELALQIFRDAGEPLGEGHALCNLGRVHQRLRRTRQAIGLQRQALDIYRERGSRYGEGYALNNLGVCHRELAEHDEAMDCHRQALDIATDIDERGLKLEVLNEFGATLLAVGRVEESRFKYESAQALAARGDHKYDHACAFRGIAETWCAEGDVEQAREYWELALELFTELGVPEAAAMRESNPQASRVPRPDTASSAPRPTR